MPLVPSYIQNLSNYVPGKSIDELEREGIKNIYKLASNENSLGPSPKALDAIKKSLMNVHRYPDMHATDLKTKLAELLVSEITPVGKEIEKLLKDRSHLEQILKKGREKANIIAEENLKNIREKVGLI